ncbi:MAG: SUF system NifU family Fe-S cluster assembly protein [Actinomycetales bacterium]|jgi:nitrogen fixation NifU-like protein|nr:SUF system NifU family Fe-S cluster assembly protein [Actinomycetales bacterium]
MEQLYQQLIIDHAKDPHGKGLAEPYAAESFQVNPTCGDEVRLRVHLRDDGTVERVSWAGQGCSISQASTSVMSELVEGRPVAEVEGLGEDFRALLHTRGEGLDEAAEDRLGDATAFTGVGRYPARIKCALLGWMALRDALVQAGVASTTTEEA